MKTNITELEVVKTLELPKMILNLKSDGIVYCSYREGVVVFEHDVEQGVNERISEFGDIPRAFLVDITSLKGISSDARRRFATAEGGFNIKAAAFYSEDEDAHEIADAFIEENVPPYPTQTFKRLEDAIVWLRGL